MQIFCFVFNIRLHNMEANLIQIPHKLLPVYGTVDIEKRFLASDKLLRNRDDAIEQGTKFIIIRNDTVCPFFQLSLFYSAFRCL